MTIVSEEGTIVLKITVPSWLVTAVVFTVLLEALLELPPVEQGATWNDPVLLPMQVLEMPVVLLAGVLVATLLTGQALVTCVL